MALPAGKPPAPQTAARPLQAVGAPAGPQARKLKKGELLFAEGENSRAMYFLKTGMIRIFKKKGDSNIEIDTVHTGQIIGELAFLDGNPRSASGEALTDCELVEISGPTFQDVLQRAPDWLKILLKTVVGRLRTASTRIRQLETASTQYDYSDKDGKRSAHYVYISITDMLKICTATLLVAARNGTETGMGTDIRVGLLQRYANQIMGVPVAKITTFLDTLEQTGTTQITDDAQGGTKVVLKDIEFLEKFIAYVNEQNLVEPSKRADLSPRGFLVMSLIAKNLNKFPKDQATGNVIVNIAEVRKDPAGGKELFRLEELSDLVKLGYCSAPNVKSSSEVFSAIKADAFGHAFKLQRVIMAVNAVNEQKRKSGKGP